MSSTIARAQPLLSCVSTAGQLVECNFNRYIAPTTITIPSEESFAAVNVLLTFVPARTPRKLISARIPIRRLRTASLMPGFTAFGQNSPRYVTNKFAFAAHDVTRTNHTSHAT